MDHNHTVSCPNLNVSVKNLPGMIVLQHQKDDDEAQKGIVGWNRVLAYYSLYGTPTDIYRLYRNIPSFTISKDDKRRRKSYRGHNNVLRYLFSTKYEEYTIKSTAGKYSIQTCVDDQQCCLITKARREDIFHPFAFLQHDKLIGGLQINFKLLMAENANDKVVSIHKDPIRSIITNMCMHGSNLKFIDNKGRRHSMAVTANALAKDQIIVKVIQKSDQLHPYEKLSYQTFENMIPLFYVLGNGIMPTIYFHLPVAEYIIHGLDLFLSRHMTEHAFYQYANYVIQRATIHHQWIIHYCSRYNIQLVSETPIRKLVLQDNNEFCLQSFLDRIQVSIDLLNTNEANTDLSAYVARQCWTWLCQFQSEPFRSIWKFIMTNNKGKNCKEDKLLDDLNSLQSLKYLSYIIHFAAVKRMNDSTRSLAVLPFREKQISVAYKNLFARRYGSILGLHWMMPILSNISHNNELYYLEDYLAPLDDLIESDIISQCYLETGAAALNIGNEYVYTYSKVKEQMLNKHEKGF